MMSKKRLLKGLNGHISNAYCCIVDYDLDNTPSPITKEKTKLALEKEYLELISIKNRLQELLIG